MRVSSKLYARMDLATLAESGKLKGFKVFTA